LTSRGSATVQVSEEFNVAVLLTNQVMADPGAGCAFMPSYPKPVGGLELLHPQLVSNGNEKVFKGF